MEKPNMEYSHKMETFSYASVSFPKPLAKMENRQYGDTRKMEYKIEKKMAFLASKSALPPLRMEIGKFWGPTKFQKFRRKMHYF
jgi:hypothetical protein